MQPPTTKQRITQFFHERGLEVALYETRWGTQIQFYPWPNPHFVGNCVVLNLFESDVPGTLRRGYVVRDHIKPRPFPEALKGVEEYRVATLLEALEIADSLRARQ